MGLAEQGSSRPSCQSGRAQTGAWGCPWPTMQSSSRQALIYWSHSLFLRCLTSLQTVILALLKAAQFGSRHRRRLRPGICCGLQRYGEPNDFLHCRCSALGCFAATVRWLTEAERAPQEAGQLATAGPGKAVPGSLDPASRAFWCALGNLYAAARTAVMRLGHAAALRPDASESPMLQNVSAASAPPSGMCWCFGNICLAHMLLHVPGCAASHLL